MSASTTLSAPAREVAAPVLPGVWRVNRLRHLLLVAIPLITMAQVAVGGDEKNFLCALAVAGSAMLTVFVMLRWNLLVDYPVSTLQVLGFMVTTQFFPLLAMLLEFKPIVFNLIEPSRTFLWIAATQLTLLAAHGIYRHFHFLLALRDLLAVRVFKRIGLYQRPGALQLWMMGVIGLMAMVYIYWFRIREQGAAGMAETGALTKFIWGFIPFAYAPMLLPILGAFSFDRFRIGGFQMLCVLGYTGLVLLVALGRNSRGAFAIAIATLAAAAFIAFLYGRFSPKWLRGVGLPLVVGGALLGLWLFVDLSTAMQMVRKNRLTVSASEMIVQSFAAMTDRGKLARYRELGQGYGMGGWSEHYSSNPVFNRFTPIKFHDNGFWLAQKLRERDIAELRNFTRQKAWAILPGPVLKVFGVHVNKVFVSMLSVGDYMFIKGTGILFGGYRTGSLVAHGVTVFGFAYPIMLIMLAMVLFSMSDALAGEGGRVRRALRGGMTRSDQGQMYVSVLLLLNIYGVALAFSAESMVDLLMMIVRGFLQMAFLYLILFHGTRTVCRILEGR